MKYCPVDNVELVGQLTPQVPVRPGTRLGKGDGDEGRHDTSAPFVSMDRDGEDDVNEAPPPSGVQRAGGGRLGTLRGRPW